MEAVLQLYINIYYYMHKYTAWVHGRAQMLSGVCAWTWRQQHACSPLAHDDCMQVLAGLACSSDRAMKMERAASVLRKIADRAGVFVARSGLEAKLVMADWDGQVCV